VGEAHDGAAVVDAAAPWYRVIVEEGHDALAVLDLDGVPLYVNPAMERLLGGAPATDRSLAVHLHPDDHDEVVARWRELEPGGPGELGRCRLLRADGAYRWVEAAARYGRSDVGPVVVVSLRTGDARRSLRASVDLDRRVVRALEELLTPHRTFLTTVAHELRTPLTAVLAAAETLEARGDELSQADVLALRQQLLRNGRRLRDRVEQFLSADSAAIVTGPERTPVVLRTLVEGVVREVFAPGADVVVEVPADVVLPVHAASLADALRALLANVVVHTGHGTAARVLLEQDALGVVLVVEDDGPGVPAERAEMVFEPFVTFDVPPYRPTVGLGLHLVDRVARAHGGRAWLEDAAGGGARVCLRLAGSSSAA
jgi:PAS domain S-box-containing protein